MAGWVRASVCESGPVSAPDADGVDERAGRPIVLASWVGTGVFAVVAVAAAIVPDALGVVAAAVSGLLFVVGCVTFLWAYVVALGRSRTDAISVADLFFLTQCAPKAVQRLLLGSVAVEVVVALATAGARLYTALAFGILAPMYGLGLAGLWGARHGTFPRRAPAEGPGPEH